MKIQGPRSASARECQPRCRQVATLTTHTPFSTLSSIHNARWTSATRARGLLCPRPTNLLAAPHNRSIASRCQAHLSGYSRLAGCWDRSGVFCSCLSSPVGGRCPDERSLQPSDRTPQSLCWLPRCCTQLPSCSCRRAPATDRRHNPVACRSHHGALHPLRPAPQPGPHSHASCRGLCGRAAARGAGGRRSAAALARGQPAA